MTATIRKDSRRYATWIAVFGTDTITIVEPPKPGPNGQLRMLVDVSALSKTQLQRLVTKMSRQYRLPSDRVLKELTESGSAPISAEDVEVREEARLF